jgi:hypothetical protein
MKVFKKIFLVVFFANVFVFKVHGQTTMMSANPLKKKEVLLYNTYQFFENSSKYDWNSKQWNNLADSLEQIFHKTLPMLGYGITDRLSVYVQFPVNYFEQTRGYKFYFNDILLMSRYAIIPSSGSKTGLTLIGASRLPTRKPAIKTSLTVAWILLLVKYIQQNGMANGAPT